MPKTANTCPSVIDCFSAAPPIWTLHRPSLETLPPTILRANAHPCRSDCEKPAAAEPQLDRNNPLTLYSLGRAYHASGALERAEEGANLGRQL
jgi:hypothetical protein